MDSDAIFVSSDLKSLAWGRYKKSTLGLENRKKVVTDNRGWGRHGGTWAKP